MENNGSKEVSLVMNDGFNLDISKAGIQERAEQILDLVRNGEVDLMKVVTAIKAMAKVEEYIMDKDTMLDDSISVKAAVIQTIQDQGEGKLENRKYHTGHVEYEVFEAGVSYDYTYDPVFNELTEKLEARKLRLRTCREENVLKKIEPEVDEFGNKLYRPKRKSTTAFKIHFKK